jgi:hypothetical protein
MEGSIRMQKIDFRFRFQKLCHDNFSAVFDFRELHPAVEKRYSDITDSFHLRACLNELR